MSADALEIGAMRDRVTLSRKDVSREEDGGQLIVYVPLATVWARVHARSASLAGFADARGVRATHTVAMRFRSDLIAGDRITWGDRVFEILSVEDLNGRREFVSCACSETKVTG